MFFQVLIFEHVICCLACNAVYSNVSWRKINKKNLNKHKKDNVDIPAIEYTLVLIKKRITPSAEDSKEQKSLQE